MPTKSSNIAIKTTTESATTAQDTRPNFRKGYQGDSISVLMTKFEKIENNSKDEFIKTSDLKAQLSSLQAPPYRFIISADKTGDYRKHISYAADEEAMKINLWVKNKTFFNSVQAESIPYTTVVIAKKMERSNFIGQNTYGTKTEVTSIYVDEFGLALANITQGNESALFSLSLPVKSNYAKSLKYDLDFYIEVELTKLAPRDELILTMGYGQDATINNPKEIYITGKYLLVNLKEVGVYKKSTGEILGWKKF